MGSIQDLQQCPSCEGVMVINSYYRSGEEYANCNRCGFYESHALRRDENGELIVNEQGDYTFDHVKKEGFGVYGIFHQNGVGEIGCFHQPITNEDVENFSKTFDDNAELDKEKSYLVKWEKGMQTILAGTNLSETCTMNFVDLMDKWEKENEEYSKCPAKGLEHFTRDEVNIAINDYLREKINYVEDDFEVVRIALVGSRIKGSHKEGSDLDVAFEYKGNYRSDAMCDTLNMEPLMFDDISVDFIPFSLHKGDSMNSDEPQEYLSVITPFGECSMDEDLL